MKKITILLVIIFTFLFSNTSWGEWSLVVESVDGTRLFYDKERLRKRELTPYIDSSVIPESPESPEYEEIIIKKNAFKASV